MSINLRFVFWILLLLSIGGGFYSQLQKGLSVETNILRLLPTTEVNPFAEEAFERFSEQNFKKVILTIEAPTVEEAIISSKSLSAQLLQSGLVSSIDTQLSQQDQEAIAQLYFKHRFHLLSDADRALFQQQGSEPFIDATLQLVYSPLSSQLISLLPKDPYLLSYRYLQDVTDVSNSPQRQLVDDVIMYRHQGKIYSVVSATLQASPFDSQAQQQLTHQLDDFQQDSPNIKLLYTGAIFYAHHAAASAKSEISTIGLGSLIGVILLLVLAFKSIRPLVLTLTSLGTGVFLGFTVTHLAFGSIHVLTLVFGASLIGVAVDYSFHYFASANESRRPLKHILGAITLGLVSSVIGYAALFSTPFPGLQQMAVFCAAGLIGAFLTVTLLFDKVNVNVNSPKAITTTFTFLSRFSLTFRHPTFLLALTALPVIAVILLSEVEDDNDNIRQLQSIPPELYQQEQTIQKMVASPATNQFFVVQADTTDELLNQLGSLNADLNTLVDRNAIEGYKHIAQFVPSRQVQDKNYLLLSNYLDRQSLSPLIELGLLNRQQLLSLVDNYLSSNGNHLDLQDWLQSPLGQRFSYLWLGEIENQVAAIITLHNIHNLEPLETLADKHEKLYFINKVDKVSAMFTEYREKALFMLGLALVAIFLLLSLKYSALIAGLILLAPIAASSLAIIVNILVAGSFNLFSTLALFLVFGIGVDYGLFYSESKKRSPYIVLAIGLSAITTFLSFGLLSLSQTPAIHAFGLTMLTGILSVFLLSPIFGHHIYRAQGVLDE
ncbi:MMPL family transporter [Kangiella japonica]|uniref:MMPL family transporter n=1 Tax=Kangiella japonica TaxID=647384 RepID=A0ABN0T0X6_9GAMM